MPQGSEDYRKGKQLPSPVTPASTVCYTITIPNATQYRAALVGVISQLTNWYTWDHPTDGTVCADCEEAAQLWAYALENATFSENCEDEMSCADVADCIENDESVQAAIAAQLAIAGASQTTVYQTSVYGTPLAEAQRSAPIATPPECDLDILFAMCTAIIDQLHKNNEDFLEILEAASNPTERARNVISAIPVVGLLPIDEAIEFIDQLVEEIQENYDAQYTTSIRDELRCALFCAARDAEDCIVTFDMLTAIFENRLGYYLDPVNTAGALVQYFLLSTWAGTIVVDIMTLVQIAFWRQASEWLGVNIRTLQIVARLVIDNPDPDWEILCTDCAIPWITVDWKNDGIQGWEIIGTFAEFEPGHGWKPGASGNSQIAIKKAITGTFTDVELYFEEELTPGIFYVANYAFNAFYTGTVNVDNLHVGWSGLSLTSGIAFNPFTSAAWASTQYVTKMRYKLA